MVRILLPIIVFVLCAASAFGSGHRAEAGCITVSSCFGVSRVTVVRDWSGGYSWGSWSGGGGYGW